LAHYLLQSFISLFPVRLILPLLMARFMVHNLAQVMVQVTGIGVIYVLDRTPNLKTKTTPKFGGCEFLFVKNLMIKTKLIILWT
jgi:hypothetical protein